MADLHNLPTIPPTPAVMRILERFNREELGNTVEVLVALLDIWDGDPDEEDGQFSEDEPAAHFERLSGGGPGCPAADPDMAVDDEGCDDNEMDMDEGYYDYPTPIPGGGSGDC